MRNVYDSIEKFYQSLDDKYSTVPKAMVEGYLRKEAWRGVSDKELKRTWNMIGWLLNYYIFVDVDDITEMAAEDYARALLWMTENNKTFHLSAEGLDKCLAMMQPFFDYLAAKHFVRERCFVSADVKKFFYPNGQFTKPVFVSDKPEIFHDGFDEADLDKPEVQERLNTIIDRLLNKLGLYFKREEYLSDLNRAVFLFSGPVSTAPESEEQFWLGFWDYFLFDYRLIVDDKHPLQHFYEKRDERLSPDEMHVIEDLMKAKFTVFYIQRLLNDAMVLCRDLMTGEEFRLPMPDYGINDYKNVLLYGHIYPQGILMLNYISSMPVSLKFRKRIKEEITRQHEIFKIQRPEATLNDFYERNAAVVRHTVNIFVTLAKLNVTSDRYLQVSPLPRQGSRTLPSAAQICLLSLARRYRISLHSQELLRTLLLDFMEVQPSAEPLAAVVGTVAVIFSDINGGTLLRRNDVLRQLNIADDAFAALSEQVYAKLELQKFDSRYLNEEGFVCALYEF